MKKNKTKKTKEKQNLVRKILDSKKKPIDEKVKQFNETQKAIEEIGRTFMNMLEMKGKGIEYNIPGAEAKGTGLKFYNDFSELILTSTQVYDKRMVKIEMIYVEPDFRGHKVATNILGIVTGICAKNSTDVGLWVDKHNKKLIKWYIDRGFKIVEIVDDAWLEFDKEKYFNELVK